LGSSLKVEGTCSGILNDGQEVGLVYYSDFDGCKEKSVSAVAFTEGIEGLITGTRSFTEKEDIYSFPEHRLILANSTGNTVERLIYQDNEGEQQSDFLKCEVRDYEYEKDCYIIGK